MKIETIVDRYEELRNRIRIFVTAKYDLKKTVLNDFVALLIDYVLVDNEANIHTLVRVIEVKDGDITDVLGVYPCKFTKAEFEEFVATGNLINPSNLEEFQNYLDDDEDAAYELDDEEALDQIIKGH